MNKKISVGMMLTIVILAMTVTFSVTMLLAMRLFDSTVSSVKEKESMYNKISELDRYVRSNDYYTIDETRLYDTISSGYLLGTGDRYARYYTAEAYAELLDIQNGVLMGIGVEVAQDQTGYAKVLKVYDGSPAQEAGVEKGNYITTIDGTDVRTMSSADAIQARLRGEAGTTVNLVWLNSESAEQTVDLTRSSYITTTIDYQLTAGDVGYIKIRQFDATTLSELDYAIRTLRNAGAASLLFDLRDNAGGLLDVALNCIDLVCPEGVMAWAESRDGTREALGSSSGDSVVDLPMVCLVNGNTASAAELFASCLRDMSGARLVGTTTFGKGTIQSSPQRLSDGSAVVVTVAQLIPSSGETFDSVGLTVDVERDLTSDEQAAYYDYTLETDPQILRAVNTAQTMSGSATVGGVNAASSGAAGSEAASSENASSETASSEAASSEAASGEAASSEAASSEAG